MKRCDETKDLKIVRSRGVVPCRNSLDGNGIYFLNGLLLLMMPTIEQPRALRICVGNELRVPRLRFSSPSTSRTSPRIVLSGWFAGTRASGAMYENSPP